MGRQVYTTTDLATLQYRIATWNPDEIVYVTDGRQQLHFRQLFAIFGRWQPEARVKLAHVWFGKILGDDGRPFKTRSGETIKLSALLDEAEERAFALVTEKNPEMPEAERREIARIIGIGGVKYADLLPNRQGRLRLFVGPDAGAAGQYRSISDERVCARGFSAIFQEGDGGDEAAFAGSDRPYPTPVDFTLEDPVGTGVGEKALSIWRDRSANSRRLSAESALQLPL